MKVKVILKKIVFWSFAILIGFVNPLFSFGLIILYYLPSVIDSLHSSENTVCQKSNDFDNYDLEDYSGDTLEAMK